MRPASSRSVVVSAAVAAALVLVGCSSGGDGGDRGSERSRRAEPERSAERSSTTAAPARIDLSEPIPGGSLYGTPRPPLENTGDDYVAIFESLTANFRWVTENPDPAVISQLFVPGTPPHNVRVEAYTLLVTRGYRWADEGYHLVSVDLIDSRPEVVTLRVVEQLEFERLVDSNGNQVGEIRERGAPETTTVTLAPNAAGKWRIADTSSADSTVVQI